MSKANIELCLDLLLKALAVHSFNPNGTVNRYGGLPVIGPRGRSMTLRVAVGPVPEVQRIRTFINTVSGNHVIQISDRLESSEIADALDLAVTNLIGAYDRVHSRVDFGELKRRRAAAERARTIASDHTLESLRSQAAKGSRLAMQLMIGGGASMVGRSESVLAVDSCGRWQVSSMEGLTQSADQIGLLAETGIWDPRRLLSGDRRVPTILLHAWVDEAAARGPVINGSVNLIVDDEDSLLAEIVPADGSKPLVVEMLDESVIATGLLPELIPGMRQTVPSLASAVNSLEVLLTEKSMEAVKKRFRDALEASKDEETAAALVHDLLKEYGGIEQHDAIVSTGAIVTWHRVRRETPERAKHNSEVGHRSFDASGSNDWLILGFGGAATANAEIILNRNPCARVRIVGRQAPFVLHNDSQFPRLLHRHVEEYGGDGRLSIIAGRDVGDLEVRRSVDGELQFCAAGEIANAVVACLGRPARTPVVLDPLINWARSKQGRVHATASFDAHGQYLGYCLIASAGGTRRMVHVLGAASRLAPEYLFSPSDAARIEAARLWDAPPESGSDAAGFLATALQAHRRRTAAEK